MINADKNHSSEINNKCEQAAFNEFEFRFSRSQGPGGQNVNKVNTKATIRWNLEESKIFTPEQKQKIRSHPSIKNRINNNGEVIIDEQGERTQARNKSLAQKKLISLVQEALQPEKERIAADTPDTLKVKYRKDKQHNSRKKHDRKWKANY